MFFTLSKIGKETHLLFAKANRRQSII